MGADEDPNRYISEAKHQFGAKNGTGERVSKIKPESSLDIGKG